MSEIDDLKKRNEQLENELSQSKKTNQQYMQNVAHQLTAPLGAIKWSIEALKDPKIPIHRKGTLLSSIYSQATILVHLIKNFSLMSDLEVDHELGQFREKPDSVDIKRLAINLANDFQPQAFDVSKKIEIDEKSFSTSLGLNKLLIEKNLVSQAISNIIENAVKYADNDSTINIFTSIENGNFCLKIKSFGIPISNAEKEKVFSRGFRGVTAKQKIAAGTGFGLYLAHRIMEFHKGKIELSTQNKYSTFSLVFPKDKIIKQC